MISTRFVNTSPEVASAMACEIVACAVTPLDSQDLCDCLCKKCEYELLALAEEVVSNDEYKNDKREFIYPLVDATDTITIKLYKYESGEWVEKATLNTATYGDYYPAGSFTNKQAQEYYVGYVLHWNKVMTSFGAGRYYVKADISTLGSTVESFSDIFNLCKYTDDAADGTVKMVTTQNGNIESSIFDFTGMNWVSYVRVQGIFWDKQPNIDKKFFYSSQLRRTQIQDTTTFTYTLELPFMSGLLSDSFTKDRTLANETLVTDYNLCNTEKYINLPVDFDSYEETEEVGYFKGRRHILKFTDRFENHRKRNY